MSRKNKKILTRFVHPQLSNASKTLLANIRFASVDEQVKTIVITSAEENEGKTIVASNLADAMATSGKRVLIVDADMRRRSIAQLLDIHPAHGIYSVLTGEASLKDAVQATNIPNLFFLDSEPNIPSPADILSTKRFASLMKKLRDLFDYVIFDSPPVSIFIDAAILGSQADATIVVARQRKTKRSTLVNCVQQLNTAQARIIGTVLTFCSDDESMYYYAYYTQEGKRINRKESHLNVLPSYFASELSGTWDPEAGSAGNNTNSQGNTQQSTSRRTANTSKASSPKSTNSATAKDNPYAPNAYKAGSSGTTAPQRKSRKS